MSTRPWSFPHRNVIFRFCLKKETKFDRSFPRLFRGGTIQKKRDCTASGACRLLPEPEELLGAYSDWSRQVPSQIPLRPVLTRDAISTRSSQDTQLNSSGNLTHAANCPVQSRQITIFTRRPSQHVCSA